MKLPRAVLRALLAGGVFYALMCVGVLVGSPDLSFAADRIPRIVIAILLSIAGPGILFSAGVGAWKWVTATILVFVALLRLAYRWWRRFPQEEWFMLPLAAAALIWILSGWLLLALAI